MQQVAVSWLTFRLTHSAFLLGLVGFIGQIPTFLTAPFAGVLIDRWNRHRILIVTQSLSLIQALTLALLVLTDRVAVWHIILLSALLGFINVFDNPTRQSFIIAIVEDKEDLGNAVALNSSIFSAARLLGPSIAGVLIAVVGEGVCFLLNGLSFIAVITSLLAMNISPEAKNIQATPLWRGLKDGFAYASGFLPIWSLLLLLAWSNLIGGSYIVIMPVIAQVVFHAGANTFGFPVAASGCGSFVGSVILASRKGVQGLFKINVINSTLLGIGLFLFSLSRILWLSIFPIAIAGFVYTIHWAVTNTALQTIVDEDKRGRVMSFFYMATYGVVPFGSLFAGSLANKIGAPATIMISGILCIISSVLFALKLSTIKRMIRPIFIKKGIITEKEKEFLA